ncbi:MAG: MGMT family protein [Planctomycetota bacterium]|nr:MGMT family protein [Planctomycetota bacterium]
MIHASAAAAAQTLLNRYHREPHPPHAPKKDHAPGKPPALRGYKIHSSMGDWYVAFSDIGLRELRLPGSDPKLAGKKALLKGLPELADQEGALGKRVRAKLERRLHGDRVDLPWEAFDLSGHGPFFTKAWRALYEIPFGQVKTYGEIAQAAGSPKAVRAAGQACGANPIVLFIPCHRVIACSGPGGFGAGLEWKAKLLKLEGYELQDA